MLGRNHGMVGLATFGASVYVAEHSFHQALPTIPQLLVGGIVAVGAALAPDLDEAHSLSGRSNPISALPIFGGHRTRTHTLVAVAAVALLAWASAIYGSRDEVAGVVAFAATMGGAWAFSGVKRMGMPGALAFGAALGFIVARWVPTGWWLIAALPGPYLSHLVGDAMTPGGVPFLMPFSNGKWSLHLFRTGKTAEKILVTPLVAAGAVVTAWLAVSPDLHTIAAGIAR